MKRRLAEHRWLGSSKAAVFLKEENPLYFDVQDKHIPLETAFLMATLLFELGRLRSLSTAKQLKLT